MKAGGRRLEVLSRKGTGCGLRPTACYLRARLFAALSLLLSALREIFDENAYSRFLQLQQLEPSRASYSAFLRENAIRSERRPRCC